jgi:ABC-type branched-chain amino acid transport system, permease component
MKNNLLSNNNNEFKKKLFTVIFIIAIILTLFICQQTLDDYIIRILNLSAIYIVLALGLNLINGFTGQFSLGHSGFMAIGAYVCALLTMAPKYKALNFYLAPIAPFLANIQLPFLPALIISGLVAALIGMLVGAPALRLKGDYLAIATLGFSEIIRIVITNAQSITNGSLGLKNIPFPPQIFWWSWGAAIISVIFVSLFLSSSYGRALKSIREDETAAQAMGIGLFKHKILAFGISSFMAGIGGALLGSLLTTIDPNMFKFTLTYNILLIVVLGGMGSITGSVISAVVITSSMEILRFLDEGFLGLPAIPGLRMVTFSILLMAVILFFPKGLLGNKEFSLNSIFGVSNKKNGQKEVKA